ncbi:hypothetical protein DFAR_1970004 [Desulfarculales bacterium]
MSERILDLGCRRSKLPGAVGLDLSHHPEADLLADFAVGSPFRDDSLDQARLMYVMEHVHDLAALLGEVHRVLRPGGGSCISSSSASRPAPPTPIPAINDT